MKKINVSKELCIGCGACVAIDPSHFEFDNYGKSVAISNDNLEDNNLLNAIESCPTNAIEIAENDNLEDNNLLNAIESCPTNAIEIAENDNSEDKNCECTENCTHDNCHCQDCHCEEK